VHRFSISANSWSLLAGYIPVEACRCKISYFAVIPEKLGVVMNQFDFIISGAGPAGLSSAISLGQQGYRVIVCEKRALPQQKACGEGIMPPGVSSLKQLGVLEHIAPEQMYAFKGIDWIDSSGLSCGADFLSGDGLGIKRSVLSGALLTKAAQYATIEQKCSISDYELTARGIKAISSRGPITGRWLIAADGLHSPMRKKAGISDKRGRWQRYGIRHHYAMAPWSNRVTVYWGSGFQLAVTPLQAREVGIAVLFDRQLFGTPFAHFTRPFPEVHRRTEEAHLIDKPKGAGPFSHRATQVVKNRIILCGDSLGYLDAITGEGISLALNQGTDLLNPQKLYFYPSANKHLTATYKRLTAHYFRWTPIALFLARHDIIRRSCIAVLCRSPRTFATILEANLGGRQLPALLHAFTPRNLFSLLLHMVKQRAKGKKR